MVCTLCHTMLACAWLVLLLTRRHKMIWFGIGKWRVSSFVQDVAVVHTRISAVVEVLLNNIQTRLGFVRQVNSSKRQLFMKARYHMDLIHWSLTLLLSECFYGTYHIYIYIWVCQYLATFLMSNFRWAHNNVWSNRALWQYDFLNSVHWTLYPKRYAISKSCLSCLKHSYIHNLKCHLCHLKNLWNVGKCSHKSIMNNNKPRKALKRVQCPFYDKSTSTLG